MSYKIGQLRKLPQNNFEELINITQTHIETPYGENDKDGALIYDFKEGEVYYFKLEIGKNNINRNIPYKIKLKDKDGNYQSLELRKFKTDKDDAVDIAELIFIPKHDFQYMVFEAQRTTEYVDDATAYFWCNDFKARRLFNLIGSESLPNNITELMRVGIQGPVGLAFAINGEKITLGKSRMFTSPEMSIKSIALLINDITGKEDKTLLYDDRNFFIMDYQYNEGVMIYE